MNDPERDGIYVTDDLVRALETRPSIVIPEDFAARVMAQLPRETGRRYVLRHSLRRARVGRSLVFAAMLVLVLGMLLMAPHTAGSPTWTIMQGLLFLQCAGLALWVCFSYKRLL